MGRKQVAELIGADAREIIFTSGATESNNLAIKGVARFYRAAGKNHIITLNTEHKCVLDSCRMLQQDGFEVTYLGVQENGLVDMEELEAAMRPETSIVSVMVSESSAHSKMRDARVHATRLLYPRIYAERAGNPILMMPFFLRNQQAVNNEIGTYQPLQAIGELCRSKRIFFHTDGAQAVGKVALDVC